MRTFFKICAKNCSDLKVHLRKTPFSKITVDDICESAGIGRRSFYRYFKDKYDLLNWLYDHDFCSTLEKIPGQDHLGLLPGYMSPSLQ